MSLASFLGAAFSLGISFFAEGEACLPLQRPLEEAGAARTRLILAGYYRKPAYAACQEYAWCLLGCDPCREDAHRLMMRCYVRQGERAEALRHYRLCGDIIHAEFEAAPETATITLFEQVRLDPSSI